jgi:inositol-1,3,4-trisphosphate 5/6-kinase / inositol-tetrakisphosphate 1-kinase
MFAHIDRNIETHPEVTVLDPPGAIAHLLDRQSMLQEVSDLDLSNCYGNFYIVPSLVTFL